ncbi:MAG: FHA domain-containing protein, partial [Myxococcota bacterium]
MDSGQPPPIHLAVRLELPEKEPRAFEYDFEQAVVTLGRDPSNDIQVPLTTVSRHHARLFFERGDYFLEDLGSTHGTKHNDRTLDKGEKRLLRAGDRITIVSFHIEFSVTKASPMDRQPGERTEQLTRRMVDEVLHSLGSAAERPSLRVMSGKEEGQRFVLNEDAAEIVIGRSPDCDVTLDDQNISRRHCLIKRDWHGFSAQDL